MLLRHPRAVPLLATHPVDQALGLALLRPVLDGFDAAGESREDALTVVQSVGVFVLGHALAQVGAPPGSDASGPLGEAPVSDPDPAYYDAWLDAGLRAMVRGFEESLSLIFKVGGCRLFRFWCCCGVSA
jgi:hypothetical protein